VKRHIPQWVAVGGLPQGRMLVSSCGLFRTVWPGVALERFTLDPDTITCGSCRRRWDALAGAREKARPA
jgi:hypothetical protein